MDLLTRIEEETIRLNRWLYAEGAGLPVADDGYAAPAAALARGYSELLTQSADTAARYFALENLAEARLAPLEQRLSAERDRVLSVPTLMCSEGPLTWRNWKAFEREASAEQRADGFEQMVARSAELIPWLEERFAFQRAAFAEHGLTPAHTFCWREGTTPEALRALLLRVGQAARAPFHAALNEMSRAVFGAEAGPAELRALYLNRMYEPNTALFSGARDWVADTQSAFARFGFDLSAVPVDVEDRPRKYPGAFCFPVATPGDVRVSVRMASPHHLVDMLYHEFGHAAHFSGIRADLPLIDRVWIHSGAHETFSTLFEFLLGEPEFLREQFGFDDSAVRPLLAFHRFKMRLTGAWLGACALTVLEAWLENLNWRVVEARFAEHMRAFTGVPVPPGFARLEPFTASLSIYPAGYVLANVRVGHWLAHLRALGGARWWRSPAAQADIRAKIQAGGQVAFPAGWEAPDEFNRAL